MLKVNCKKLIQFLVLLWLNLPIIAWANGYEFRFEREIAPTEPTVFSLSPTAIDIAPDGSVWVADATNHRIQHFSTEGTLIFQFGSEGNGIAQFKAPNDIDVDQDGSIWVADTRNCRVQHFHQDGTLIKEFFTVFGASYYGCPGSDGKIYSTQIGAIAIAKDGSFWITGSYGSYGNNLQHHAPNGYLIDQAKRYSGPFAQANDLTIAEDGSVWYLERDSGELGRRRIIHRNPTGQSLQQIDYGVDIAGLALGQDGSLWLLLINNTIHHINSDGSLIKELTVQPIFGSGQAPFDYSQIALALDGSIWLAYADRLLHLTADGQIIKKIKQSELNVLGFHYGSPVIAPDNSIWIVDATNYRLNHFDSNGLFLGRIGGHKEGTGAFGVYGNDFTSDRDINYTAITNLTITPDTSVWALEQSYHPAWSEDECGALRLQHFKELGGLLNDFKVCNIHVITSALDGSLWAIDRDNKIIHFSQDGAIIAELNDFINASDPYHLRNIKVAHDGSLWLLSWDLMLHIKADGTLIEQFGSSGEWFDLDFTFAADGSLWIHGFHNNRLLHYQSNGTLIEQFENISSAAVDSANNLWIANKKYVLRPKQTSAQPYKAIIVAGGNSLTGPMAPSTWDATWQVALRAKNALIQQGFEESTEIKLLTAGSTNIGLGWWLKREDLQTASKASFHTALTTWAKDSQDLLLYLVAPAAPGQIQLNATETVSAQELAQWLAELEKTLPGKITIIIDAPYAGSFLKPLANPKRPRYVIASTQSDQPSLLVNQGVNSFSYPFWSQIMHGTPLRDALVTAQRSISPFRNSNQMLLAQGDANGDGLTDLQDYAAVGDYCLGMCTQKTFKPPVILPLISPTLTLNNSSVVDLSISVQEPQDLLMAWAIVQRPEPATAVSITRQRMSLEQIPLRCDSNGQCFGHYHRLHDPGQYRITFYAQNQHYQLSEPVTLEINQPRRMLPIPAEYVAQEGRWHIYDLVIDGQHYHATLEPNNEHFVGQLQGPAQDAMATSAVYDVKAGELTIPSVTIGQQSYRAFLKRVKQYWFQLLNT